MTEQDRKRIEEIRGARERDRRAPEHLDVLLHDDVEWLLSRLEAALEVIDFMHAISVLEAYQPDKPGTLRGRVAIQKQLRTILAKFEEEK